MNRDRNTGECLTHSWSSRRARRYESCLLKESIVIIDASLNLFISHIFGEASHSITSPLARHGVCLVMSHGRATVKRVWSHAVRHPLFIFHLSIQNT